MVQEIGEAVVGNISGGIQPALRRSGRLRRPPPGFQAHEPEHQAQHQDQHRHQHHRQSNNINQYASRDGNDQTGANETPYWRLEIGDPRQRRGDEAIQHVQAETQQSPQDEGLPKSENKTSNEGRKPWETLVIGASLGENLSKIEYKNRQILQQKFVLEWSEKNEPGSVPTQQKVLAVLNAERADIEDNEENNLPADQLEARTQIGDRLETLRLALERSQCKDEAGNIKAAIAGYESGEIACSSNFTLIYAGEIVDTCPSYESFTVNRKERLDGYSEILGPGWLWHEPPLAGPGAAVHAKKGFCLHQGRGLYHGIAEWSMLMRFVVDENKVRRSVDDKAATTKPPAKKKRSKSTTNGTARFALRSATFKVMLDSGATLPYLSGADLKHLGIDMKQYAAQSVVKVNTVNGTIVKNVYELDVGIGAGLEEEGWHSSGKGLGWPHEQGILGGLCPVVIPAANHSEDVPQWHERLSGVFPFKVCYMSSVPTKGLIWLGEHRKDVLGANRFPPYQRYGTEYLFDPGYPPAFEKHRSTLGTPEEMIFVHKMPGGGSGDRQFIDADLEEIPGRTTWTHMVDEQVAEQAEFGPGLSPVKGVARFSGPQENWIHKWKKPKS